MNPPLARTSLEASGRILRTLWFDGHKTRFHAIRLRNNASDASNLNLATREVVADVTTIPANITIVSAEIDAAGGLCLAWNEDRPVSQFHPGWLRCHDYANPPEILDP
jgi:gamma-butyrobetaine dioxygenase